MSMNLDIVAVVRQCRQCKAYKTIGAFARNPKSVMHVCDACMKRNILGADTRGTIALARSLVITELGRADLRRWRREQTA